METEKKTLCKYNKSKKNRIYNKKFRRIKRNRPKTFMSKKNEEEFKRKQQKERKAIKIENRK